jgi:methanogenic corrinoid protein MtbC1
VDSIHGGRALTPADAHPVDALLRALEQRDRPGALAVVRSVLERGWSPQRVITGLLAPAQREVGHRWERGEWSVVQEHAATAIVDGLLTSGSTEQQVDASPRPEIVVACAEGDWHVLPVRMLAEHLRLDGWQVLFVGASAPADHLRRFVAEVRPLAVAVGCSVPVFLPGLRRTLEAVAAEGVPSIAGGGGCGPDAHRALVLGAHAWAPDADTAARILERWHRDGSPPRAESRANPAAADLAALRPRLVEEAFDRLAGELPVMARLDERQLRRTAEDIDFVFRSVEASVLTDDRRVIDEFVPWLRTVLTGRGLPPDVVGTTLEVVAGCLPAEHEPSAGWLLDASARPGPATES